MHVLGTAGHVDHGKSTLIEALTGIDPDRLAEEKARGLTIDLGFAWMATPRGREVGIVDVPGHERFVHNMLAGAGSIDATIFVVAANEGWMPQSEEHLAILDLLGARGGVVALTKADTVDADVLALAREEIASHVAGTVLQGAQTVTVSARTGDGLDELRSAIDELLDRVAPSPDRGRPRLFVDRSFSIKGAGTVVTGTLSGGSLRVEDEVEILPAGARGRIRGIQTHRRARDGATPGARVALNVAGVDRHEIGRGDAVVLPRQWIPATALGVRIRAVRTLSHTLTARGAYKLYLGAAEVDARVRLLGVDRLKAGEEAFARIALMSPVVATELDRFVLRDSGREATVAGGIVLDAHPRRRMTADSLRARYEARENIAACIVAERGFVPLEDIVALTGTAEPPAVRLHSFVVDREWMHSAVATIASSLERFHAAEPLARGMSRDDARKAAAISDAKLFAEIVSASDRFASEGPLIRLAEHAVELSPEQQLARKAALESAAGFSPPPVKQLQAEHGAKLVGALFDSGDLIKVSADIAFTRESLEDAKRILAAAFATEGAMTASRIRELLGTSRKFVIPLLEYLDATGVTRRDGDLRAVR